MWFYLFGKNKNYPEPATEIKKLADLHQAGELVYWERCRPRAKPT